MKIFISLLSLLNGGYMLIDGLYVIVNGKYIGPQKPGPWANLFYKLNIDVYKLGPMFILFGIAWFAFLFALWTNNTKAYIMGMAISVLTLWYLPVGTVISIIVMALIFFMLK
ncbi:MAG TPA: hypothetical protein PK736_07585 [Bacteroidia bacterium]|nr:hypothetical protein [Bacteroidia bacterium]